MIYLAGYVGRGKPLDWCIRAATASRYSHVELVDAPRSSWASASWRDGGVRAKRIKPKAGHWHLTRLPTERGRAAWEFVAAEAGKGYDVAGAVFGPTLGLRLGAPDRWFCSELIAHALMQVDLLPSVKRAAHYSPGSLIHAVEAERAEEGAAWTRA